MMTGVKVWIIVGDDYEDQAVRSVHASREVAERELARLRAADPWERLKISEHDVLGEADPGSR